MRKLRAKKFLELRAALTKNDYTIKQYADKLGISAQAVSYKLAGDTQFTLKEILTTLEWLDVDMGVFVASKKAR